MQSNALTTWPQVANEINSHSPPYVQAYPCHSRCCTIPPLLPVVPQLMWLSFPHWQE